MLRGTGFKIWEIGVEGMLVVEPERAGRLESGERGRSRVLGSEGGENSRIAVRRLTGVL